MKLPDLQLRLRRVVELLVRLGDRETDEDPFLLVLTCFLPRYRRFREPQLIVRNQIRSSPENQEEMERS